VIAFLGSVFSPYYAWSRRRGRGDPMRHCAVNVALYGRPGAWAMTERGEASVDRSATRLAIGPSSLDWDGATLTIRLDERTFPLPGRVRGTVRVTPRALTGRTFTLDPAGLHRWSPLGPCSRVEVELDRPALRWSGPGYLDRNAGAGPLEDSFASWNWSRAPLRDGAAILYESLARDGSTQCLALRVDGAGEVGAFEPPALTQLPRTFWRVPRETRAEGGRASVVRTLTDAPFYSRSVIRTSLLGEACEAVHESLDMDRFRLPVVQGMLAFKIPRALRG
jgi:carotenoid 1,2-hydratase